MNDLAFISDLMTVILGYVEIDRFKAEKEGKYYEAIAKLSHYEH